MDIKYRVISIDEKEHSFIVRYYTDLLTEEHLATHLDGEGKPILGDDGKPTRCRADLNINMYDVHATLEQLEKRIKECAPGVWLELLEHMKQNDTTVALTNLKENVAKEGAFTYNSFKPTRPKLMEAKLPEPPKLD